MQEIEGEERERERETCRRVRLTLLRFADHLSFFSQQTRSSTFESQCCGSCFTFFTPHTVVNVPAQT